MIRVDSIEEVIFSPGHPVIKPYDHTTGILYMCEMCVCQCMSGIRFEQVEESVRQDKNDKNKNDEDGGADIIDVNSTCISLANGIRFSYSAVIIFFNTAHNDTLWYIVKLQHKSP